jgi:hypothetical protein
MSSFSFCSSWARNRERRFNCDSIYFIELDFAFFCTLLSLFSLSEIQRWIVSLCDFFYVLFRFRSIIFHLSIVVSIIAKSLSHIISSQHIKKTRFLWFFFSSSSWFKYWAQLFIIITMSVNCRQSFALTSLTQTIFDWNVLSSLQ